MTQRLDFTLSELHCEAQSEQGGCEPYLFTSFFAIGDDNEVQVTSPQHDDVRGAFANDVQAGQTLPVPQELGTASFDLEGSSRLVGVAALVIDEDLSRDVAVEKAHRAFHQEVEAQLKAFAGGRGHQQQLSEDDITRIHDAVLSKVRGAVHGTYDYSDLHRDQDDHLGIGIFSSADGTVPISGGAFTLPLGFTDDRFTLRGDLAVG
jgi:hypothetical protein